MQYIKMPLGKKKKIKCFWMRQPNGLNGQDHNEGRRRRSKRGSGIAGDNQVDFVCQIHAEVAQEPQNLRECVQETQKREKRNNG